MKRTVHTLADLKRLKAAEPARKPSAGPSHPPAAHDANPRSHASRTPHPPQSGTTASSTPSPDAIDRALFRHAMRHVRPLPERGPRARTRHTAKVPDAWLQARRAHAQDFHPGAAGGRPPIPQRAGPQLLLAPLTHAVVHDPEANAYRQPGCGTDVLRHLRRGKWPVQATLDLHGSNLEQAMERLERFLDSCQAHAIRCVRIVHGKGMGSRNSTPILKTAVRQHLCRLSVVRAWIQCAERDGGAGAVTALLRLPERAR